MCEDYKDQEKAIRVKQFIQILRNILEAKPEIKNAPKSDVPYM